MQDILLLHGAIGAKSQLFPLAEILKQNYKVHLLDFSGHGGKPFSTKAFSIPLFADEVNEYLQEHKIAKTHIFGYSMGGYVAMYLAKQEPQLVNRIITLATKFYWDEAVAAKEVKMLDGEIIEQKVPAFAAQLKERHQPNDWKEVLSKTRTMLLELGKQNALSLPGYKNIQSAALLLRGDKDKMVTTEETMAVQNALPTAEFMSLPNTPHPIEQIDTALLASTITDFLARS
jgi:pimeloyl-ACP methyl ester carboxylesterase